EVADGGRDHDAVHPAGRLGADARRDLPAHAVPADDVALAAHRGDEPRARFGHAVEAEIGRQRREAVARRIPGDDAVAARDQPLGLEAPVLLGPVDTVQEEDRDASLARHHVIRQPHVGTFHRHRNREEWCLTRVELESESMLSLRGKVAFVAGAGTVGPGWGNGKATAALLARQGARVYGTDINAEAVAETRAIIEREGGECATRVCDMTDSEAVRAAVEDCTARFGRIDILVNNVGGSAPGDP